MRFKMLPLFILLLSAPVAYSMTFNVGAGNTNWTALGGIPTSSDIINVQAGGRLTVDVGNAVCGTLNLGTATGAGTVGFVSGSKLTVTTLNVGGGGNSGSIDMSLGGTLTFGTLNDTMTGQFNPGNGTILLTSSVTLPTTAEYDIFNILTIANGTTTLGQNINVTALNFGAVVGGTSGTLDLKGKTCSTNSISILGGGTNRIDDSTTSPTPPGILTVNLAAGTLSYNAQLTGNLKLIKDGPGTLSLSGGGNSYTGGTQVAGGTLQLGANNCLPTATDLTLGNGGAGPGIVDMNAFSQTVRTVQVSGTAGTANMVMSTSGNSQFTIAGTSSCAYAGAITGSVSFNVNTTGTVTLNAPSNYAGATSIQNGTLQMGALNVLPSSTTVVLGNGSNSGTLALAGFSQAVGGIGTNGSGTTNKISTTTAATIKVGAGGGSPMSVFGGSLESGTGTLTLEVDNNHTLVLTSAAGATPFGALNVISGTLQIGAAGALPTTIPVTLGAGSTPGTLDINGFDVTIGQLSSSGSNNGNQIRDNTAPQPQNAKTLTTNITGTVSFAGQCTAKLTKTGAGTLTLTQSGAVSILNVQAGTVACGAANTFNGSNTSLTLGNGASSGILNLNGTNQTIGTIGTSGTGGVNNGITSVGAATLTLQNTQPGSPFSFDGRISGAISVILNTSAGSPFTLAASNTYTGTTTVSNGSMVVTGSATSSAFTLNSSVAGPLSGTGSIGALTVGNGAIVTPGTASVGALTATSANFSTGGILKIRIPSNSSSDKLQIGNNTLTLGGSSAIELDLNGYGSALPTSNVTIVDCGGSVSGQFGLFNVINNTSGYAVNLDYSTPGKVIAVVGAIPVIANNAFPTANAGGNFNYNIIASNSPSSYGASGLPPGINLVGSQLTGVPTTAGTYNVTLSATNKGGTGTLMMPLTVNPGPFSKLQLLLPGENAVPGTPSGKNGLPTAQNAGASFNVTVNAVDDFWNVVSTVTDMVSITSNDPTATLPSNAALVAGTQTFAVTLKAASPRPAPLQPTMLLASDATDGSKQQGMSAALTVNAGAFAKLQLLLPGENAAPGTATGKTGGASPQTSDVPFNITVNAVDAYFNVVSNNDFVTYSSTDPLVGYVVGEKLNNGTLNTFARFRITGNQTLTVTDLADGTKTDTSPSVLVAAGPYVRLLVLAPGETSAPGTANGKTGTPVQQTSGTPFTIQVHQVDAYFNLRAPSGTVKLTSSDPDAILPGQFTFIVGQPIPDVTLVTGPSQTISAEDVNDPTKNSLPSSLIPLSTITSSLTSISPDAAVLNGVAFELTVTGTNFINTSVVRWNGSDRVTTFDSDTQLRAQILASDLLFEGRVDITVYSPPPGTGSTTASTFFVYSGLATGSWVVTNTSNAGPGSLRLAMDSCRSGDTITFDSDVFDLTNADAATVISVSSELPALDDGNITIDAQDRRVTINGSSAPSACGLVITSNGNVVYGLSIVSFPSSGVCIKGGAKSNIIGGNRKTGTGPNGQGLRIGNCGAFGVEIDGAGTSQNVVKACWLGLDASGTAGQPNLAGVLIKGGASNNIIGGTVDGEANVISGNTFEGVTISGTGTDNNTVIGNVVGAAAVVSAAASRGYSVSSRDDLLSGRGAVGNGTTGVFLSKGTNNSNVGGENAGEGNGIGNNGGNGVEVRANQSRRNSARSNGISKNRRGGIALFDGSNDGVTGPTFSRVTGTPKTSAAGSRSDFDTLIVGRASVNTGTVEVFADPDDQGSRLVGRAIVVNGDWQVTGSVTDLENITATFTDDNGNTSAFAFFGKVPTGGSGGGATDTDGDGISDVLELLAGSDPNNPADAPTAQGAVAASKFSSGLNFAITGKDSIKTSLVLTLPTGFAIPLATVGVQVDSVSKTGTLDAKGKSTSTTVALKMSTKKGTTITTLAVGIKASDLRTGLTPSGMTDKTTATTGETLTVPLAVSLSANGGTTKYVYVGSASVLYKAVQGKRGKAALSR